MEQRIEDLIRKAVEAQSKEVAQYTEEMVAAYYAHTNIPPDQVALVIHFKGPTTEVRWIERVDLVAKLEAENARLRAAFAEYAEPKKWKRFYGGWVFDIESSAQFPWDLAHKALEEL